MMMTETYLVAPVVTADRVDVFRVCYIVVHAFIVVAVVFLVVQ